MASNNDSSDLVVQQGITTAKTASATDRQHSQLRQESSTVAHNEAVANWENNIRDLANREIGRSRNLTRVV
jgi:hypothetical protein